MPMKPWRKIVFSLLMVTVPLSLWAAVPSTCGQQADVQSEIPMEHESSGSGHAHHESGSAEADATPAAEPQSENSHASMNCDCCGDCMEACTMAGTTALQARQFESTANSTSLHFAQTRNSQLRGGPDYPSLYRPPIAQI